MIYCRVGYPPQNMISDIENNENISSSWSENQFKIRSSIQNFLINNQIVISIRCSKMIKNAISI